MPKVSSKHKEEKRNEILQAALKVFQRKGYEAATMKEIVEESGKSFGGVYMYYSGKEEIFVELLTQAYSVMGQQLILTENETAWAAFNRFLDQQFIAATKVEDGLSALLFEYFVVGRKVENRKILIKQRHQAVYGSIHRLLSIGVERGEYRPSESIESIVHVLISFLDGVFFESLIVGADRIRIEEQFATMRKMIHSILFP